MPSSDEWPWSRDALLRFADAEAVVWVDDEVNPCVHAVTYTKLVAMADQVSRAIARTTNCETGVGLCLENSLAAVGTYTTRVLEVS